MLDRRSVLIGAGLTPLGAAPAAARECQSGVEARIGELATAIVRAGTPAITAGYARGGYLWSSGFGQADVENAVPATSDTAYRYASVQKSMTAVAVLQLAEAGKIDLDADIRRYVPYYPAKRWTITPRQLLGHLGGVPHYVNRAVEQHFTDHKDTRTAIAVFAGYDLVAEPGTRFSYSSYGYNLLGAAIEEVSGAVYGDYMRDHVWRPAGMTATRMDDPYALIPHRARGYRRTEGVLRNSEFVDISSRFAAGGTRGTVPDLLRFMQALNDGRLLPEHRVEEMYTPMRTRAGGVSGFPRTEGYAMGWSILRANGRRLLYNDGGQQETRTMIVNLPEQQLAIATAQNLEEDPTGLPLVLEMYQLLTGDTFEFKAAG
jgi:CubicO group peptidase (beta-lactamase class C family)